MNDGLTIASAAIGTALIAQLGTDMGVPQWLANLSSTGVLGIVFYVVLCRFEKRLDDAFKECKSQNDRLFNLLESEKDK